MTIAAANWKMHKTRAEAKAYLDAFLAKPLPDGVSIVLFPSFLSLETVISQCQGTAVEVGAQNMHFEDSGAFTGEVSGLQLLELGVKFLLVGHSERRHCFQEPNEWMGKKVTKALELGITPILCVGETKEERDAGKTEAVLQAQLEAVVQVLLDKKPPLFHVAYEPVWAIGTGFPCNENEAQRQAAWIKTFLTEKGFQGEVAVLYGGSVKPENINGFMKQKDLSGALVGGASLDPQAFYQIVIGCS